MCQYARLLSCCPCYSAIYWLAFWWLHARKAPFPFLVTLDRTQWRISAQLTLAQRAPTSCQLRGLLKEGRFCARPVPRTGLFSIINEWRVCKASVRARRVAEVEGLVSIVPGAFLPMVHRCGRKHENNEQVICFVCLVNLVNTRVLLPLEGQSSDPHRRYRRYPKNQPFLSFHLARFSNPTVPQFHISNCASCLCLRHVIIIPICFFLFFKFFIFHTPKVSAFFLATRKCQKSQLTSARPHSSARHHPDLCSVQPPLRLGCWALAAGSYTNASSFLDERKG